MLTETAIKYAKPKEKPYKLADKKGLYVLIQPTGGKLWRFDYRIQGKRKTLALGQYPDVGLALVRDRRDDARKRIAQGIDPGAAKQAEKAARAGVATNSLEVIAREWRNTRMTGKSDGHRKKTLALLEKDVFPWLGGRPLVEVEAPDILDVLRCIESRGANELTHVTKRIIGQDSATPSPRGAHGTIPRQTCKGRCNPWLWNTLPPSPTRRKSANCSGP